MPLQSLDEEEAEAGTYCSTVPALSFLSRNSAPGTAACAPAELVGRLPEIVGQFAHHTDVSPRSILRVITTLSCGADLARETS